MTQKTKHKSPRKSTKGKAKEVDIKKEITDIFDTKGLLKKDNLRFLTGLLCLVIALFQLLAFVSYLFTGMDDQSYLDHCSRLEGTAAGVSNYAGPLGARIADFFINQNFGVAAFFIPIFLILLGMKLMKAYHVRIWKWFINFTILMIWISLTLSSYIEPLIDSQSPISFLSLGGNHGQHLHDYIVTQLGLGQFGLFLVIATTAIIYLIYLTDETIEIIRKLLHPQDYLKGLKERKQQLDELVTNEGVEGEIPGESYIEPATPVFVEDGTTVVNFSGLEDEATDEAIPPSDPLNDFIVETGIQHEDDTPADDEGTLGDDENFEVEQGIEEAQADGKTLEPYDPKLDLEFYEYPTLDLLEHYTDDGGDIDMAEQMSNKDRIIQVLRNFGIEISSIKATVGPTITLYEITPAPGVRINKIRGLEDDIALALSAIGIRIIAPIPGKGTIGIEVPNAKPRIVSMESILNSKKFQDTTFELPICLGKTITNEVYMVDLAKMPHLLVAGATGQGKSVGLNAIITSLMYKKHPSELKFVMVDPKKVEFSIYAPIENHFLAKVPDEDSDPIITDVSKVVQTLNSLCKEMDDRYDLLKMAGGVRNIKEYNKKFRERHLNPEHGHRFLPYIVVIIDEFGDLIMTAGREVEMPIARIAQLARAVGIHMVIATQRPTTNIITGTIKANFPARMAFKVSAMIDSRTILDRPGAERLVGRGDMLFLAGSDPVRVQCAFVDTPEVENITRFIARQQSYGHPFELPEVALEGEAAESKEVDMKHLDPLFREAATLVVVHQQGSTSLIQRKFSIGYNRAGRLMDQLEQAGIVGPTHGSKPRDVLCENEIDLEMKLSGLNC